MSSPTFDILSQGTVVPRKAGVYTSFPCLFREPGSQTVQVLYRRAFYDADDERPGMRAHGLEGSLYLKSFDPATGKFGKERLFLDGAEHPPGLIDGVITTVQNRLMVFARAFPREVPVMVASGPSLGRLSPFRPFRSRPRLRRGAQWGRVVVADQGRRLYQVYYGGPHDLYARYLDGEFERPITRPALYESTNGGKNWRFVNWIAPVFLEDDLTMDETALLAVNGRLYALMRVMGATPGPLFLTCSADGGRTWSEPQRSGLFGQAPVFYRVPRGPILAGFRGYVAGDDPEVGGTFCISVFDPAHERFSQPFEVETYAGNHYDGGYGDLIWLPETQALLAVYYASPCLEPRNPGLRYSLLGLAPKS